MNIGDRYAGLMPLLVMTVRFGIECSFTLTYLANAMLFPTLFSATSNGICNFFARICTIFSSEVAELEDPVPIQVFTLVAAVGVIFSFLIKTK